MKFLTIISDHFSKYIEKYIVSILVVASFSSCIYFFQYDQHLNYYDDSLARMNISRRVFDNLTPGFAQLGGIWLPVPQLIMLPFVLNDFLWRSGIAGMVVSSVFFVVGGLYLFKSMKVMNVSNWAGLLALLVYLLNINVLYTQTTAMSETSFMSLSAILSYGLLKWAKEDKTRYLLLAGVMISLLTLIRYEALALLPSSILLVGFISYTRHKRYHKAESEVIIFSTLAGFGFILWTAYLALIFGDPLYWKNIYVDINPATASTVRPDFIHSIWWYLTSVVWMNGIIPVLFSIIGMIYITILTIKNKTTAYLPVLLQMSVFGFVVLALMRKTPISQPVLNVENLLSIETNLFIEFNIRYGMLMLPLIVLLIAFLINRNFILKLLFILLFSIQIFNTFYPNYTSIYQIPFNIKKSEKIDDRRTLMTSWIKQHYDGGLILVSAARHDPQIFKMDLPYKLFIHEGTAQYWEESLNSPAKYATWIIMDYSNLEQVKDPITTKLKDSALIEKNFNLVYNDQGMRIYKIKDRPTVLIN